MIAQTLIQTVINRMERGQIPDSIVRWGIRRLCRKRLRSEIELHTNGERAKFIAGLKDSPIAVNTQEANDQHYELPSRFFQIVLGENRKYSGCYWPQGVTDLDQAEVAALEESMSRAQLADGMDILELGCGWGSLTLSMARKYPNSKITGVSNSHSQRQFIENLAKEEGLSNVRIITADMNEFSIDESFDRVVSIEMFEHMRNYHELLKRVSGWLKDDGMLFVHVFCHKDLTYPFETEDEDDWMGRYFFTGGIMPSIGLYSEFDEHMMRTNSWTWNGVHYEKTANAWLENMDQNRTEIMALFNETYGESQAALWFERWRIFFMACAELFGYQNGEQWMVTHATFVPKRSA